MSLPINFLGRSFAKAELQIVNPPGKKAIPVQFNPSEYKIKKENTFAEIPIPGLEAPALQYVRGGARVLSLDVLVDTSDDPSKSVAKLIAPIEALLAQDTTLHAPPIIKFVWADQGFPGVLVSLESTYLLFHSDGKPLRAKLSLAIKEYRPAAVARKAAKNTSPDVEKRYVVRAGETLSSISGALFRDPSHWREIAVANGISDPRSVAPGTVLTVPRLEGQRA